MIKMIVVDMDGTLLNSKGELDLYTIEVLLKVQQEGVRLVLATGRNYTSLQGYAQQLKMSEYGGYYLGVNGQQITNVATNETTYIKVIPVATARRAIKKGMELELEVIGVVNDSLFVYIPEALMKRKEEYVIANNITFKERVAGVFGLVYQQKYDNIYYIKSYEELTIDVNKVVFAEEPEILAKHRSFLEEEFSEDFEFAYTSPRWMESMAKGISKGNSLISLANELNIELDEILVFGDGENDLSMLRVVKHSIAMENAMECVKQEVSEITESNDDAGVAKAVMRHVYGKEN